MPNLVNSYSSEVFGDPTNITIAAVGNGNSICFAIKVANGSQPIISVSDNQSNTYNLDYTTSDQTDDADVYFYSCHNITNAPTQVSIDTTGNNLSDYGVFEFSGLAASGAFDESNSATGNNTTPSVGFTTDSANQAVIAILMLPAGRNVTADSPYTEYQPYADPVYDTFLVTADIGAAGAKTASATLNSGVAWKMAVVSYRAASTNVDLVVQDAAHGHAADNVALTQQNTLAVQDCNHAHAADNIALTQANVLVVADSLHGHTADNVDLVQQNTLVVQESNHDHLADNITLSATSPSLSVADCVHATLADNLALTVSYVLITSIDGSSEFKITAFPDAEIGDLIELTSVIGGVLADVNINSNLTFDAAENVLGFFVRLWDANDQTWSEPVAQYFNILLTVQDSIHSHAADGVTTSIQFTLSVADCTHSHAVDNLALTQANTLAIEDALHSTTVDNLELSQSIDLVVSDSLHTHTADNVSLTQQNSLVVAESVHGHTVDNLALVQQNTLSVQECLHATTADNVELTNATILIVQDSLHETLADNVALTQANTLAIQESLHSHAVDNLVLTQASTLTVAECVHATTADNLALIQGHLLTVADAAHSHLADSIVLDFSATLVMQDALHSHVADALQLVQANSIVVQDCNHVTSADLVNLILYLTGLPPEARRIAFAAELREIRWLAS